MAANHHFHAEYIKGELESWCESSAAHHKARAVLAYVRRGSTVADLVSAKILHVGPNGKLLTDWDAPNAKPEIFRLIAGAKGEQDQGSAFVRWLVEIPGDPEPAVWRDRSLHQAWAQRNASQMQRTGLCMATGSVGPLAGSHPKRLRHPGDGAKLISSNDASGFTYRGRFTDDTGDQACGIGFETSQKAHLALRWLIARQAFRNGDQVVVSWAVRGEVIPDLMGDTFGLLGMSGPTDQVGYRGDAGQSFALAIKKKIAGYRSILTRATNIVIMGLDAATPGRMAITYYRELDGAEFLDRVESWHHQFAWFQSFGKDRMFIGTPAPRDIAEAAYGTKVDEKLRKACVERLLPCIVDGQRVPRDLVDSSVRRASRRGGLEAWEWEKALGIACALYKGSHSERNYDMALEEDRTSRDYLYGRLLAVADRIEGYALRIADEKRDTAAARLMQRFSDHPHSTWRTIELGLSPYKARIRGRSAPYLYLLEQQVDQIIGLFEPGAFIDDRRLTGEFLLGYHCQRAKLNEPRPAASDESDSSGEDTHV